MCSDLGYHAAVPGIGVGTGEAGGPAPPPPPPPIFYLRDFINIHTCCADCHVAVYITFSPPPQNGIASYAYICQGFCHGQFMLMELFRFAFLFSHSYLPSMVSYLVSNFHPSMLFCHQNQELTTIGCLLSSKKCRTYEFNSKSTITVCGSNWSHSCRRLPSVAKMRILSALPSFLKRNHLPERKDRTSRLWDYTHIQCDNVERKDVQCSRAREPTL